MPVARVSTSTNIAGGARSCAPAATCSTRASRSARRQEHVYHRRDRRTVDARRRGMSSSSGATVDAGLASRMLRVVPLLLLIGATAAPRDGIVFASGSWAAIDRGATCEALSRSAGIAAKGKVQAIAGFTFSPDRRRWGEFHARLRRMPRQGAAIILHVDDRPFLLVSSGNRGMEQRSAAGTGDHRRYSRRILDERRRAGRRGATLHRSLFARRRGDGDRRRGAACAGKNERR